MKKLTISCAHCSILMPSGNNHDLCEQCMHASVSQECMIKVCRTWSRRYMSNETLLQVAKDIGAETEHRANEIIARAGAAND